MSGRRGRPRLEAPAVQIRVTLSLHPGYDADLLAFFAPIPPGMRAATIKLALRSGSAVRLYQPGADEQESDLDLDGLMAS